MAYEKFYTEEELIEKIESREFGWLDYINHHSREWKEEYEEYCEQNGLSISDESAERFLHYKDEQLEAAMERGDA